MMQEKIIEGSSSVRRIAYSKETQTLEVEFLTGAIYRYSGFPESMWLEITNAPSVGSFIHAQVKGKYPYVRVE
jgi:hypothetical protein